MPDRPAIVAAFDVDGTLTTRDCVTPFLWHVAGTRLPLALGRHPVGTIEALARRDRDALKAIACSALRGTPASRLSSEGEAFAAHVARSRFRPDTVARLGRHLELGHHVVLVSASLQSYLDPLGRILGVDGVVCTRLEIGPDGRATGLLDGPNCRGDEKPRRLAAWLADRGIEPEELWAYGDSDGDRPLLARADRPVRIGKEPIAPEPR